MKHLAKHCFARVSCHLELDAARAQNPRRRCELPPALRENFEPSGQTCLDEYHGPTAEVDETKRNIWRTIVSCNMVFASAWARRRESTDSRPRGSPLSL